MIFFLQNDEENLAYDVEEGRTTTREGENIERKIMEERAASGVTFSIKDVVSVFNLTQSTFIITFLEHCSNIALKTTKIVEGCAFSCVFPLDETHKRRHIVVCFNAMGEIKNLNTYALL